MDLDPEVVRALRRGELAALEAVYRAFGQRVRRLCGHLLGRSADPDDATQDVFLKIFERARQYEGRARFSTWLYRVTVHHCLNLLEREERRAARPLGEGEHEPEEHARSPLDAAHASEARERLERLLARLSAEHRAVIVLREIEGQSYEEIAGSLAIPIGTVMSRLARARERLMELAPARRPLAEPEGTPR